MALEFTINEEEHKQHFGVCRGIQNRPEWDLGKKGTDNDANFFGNYNGNNLLT